MELWRTEGQRGKSGKKKNDTREIKSEIEGGGGAPLAKRPLGDKKMRDLKIEPCERTRAL